MILKRRKIPREIEILDALISRVKQNHPSLPQINKELAIRQKGFRGELKVDYFLEQLADQTTILQDVCLEMDGKTIQIDTIIITNFSVYCIEVKNIEGTILFNTTFRQFVQKNGNDKRAFRYPLNQAENHCIQLQLWLQRRQFKNVPVSYLIAISEPSTIIEVEGDEEEIANIVAHAEFIPRMIMEKDKQMKNAGQQPLAHRQLGQMILRDSTSHSRNIVQNFNLRRSDILDGVKCPNCSAIPMQWVRRSWQCSHCQKRSIDAHLKALDDYFLLVNPTITNKEARKFLKVNSRHTAYRLLISANLQYVPDKKVWVQRGNG